MRDQYLPADVLSARIEEKSVPEPNSGCWLWLGADVPAGYGQMWNGFRPEQAHRLSYRAAYGPIPGGAEIDHKCRTPRCVNPAHMEAVPHRENMRRSRAVVGENARKTSCKRGHVLSGDNLKITPSGARQCRECLRFHARNAKARRHA